MDNLPSRRSVLRLGAAAIAPLAAAGFGEALLPAAAHAADGTRRPPPWTREWRHAIRDLRQFRHRCPAVHFPRRALMLTIDDGPSRVWTPRYLRLLAKHDVRATFCMIGEQIHPNRHIAREVVEHGHVIANHTWDHDEQLTYASPRHIRSEISRTTHAIHHATGFVPSQFRAPGGTWGPALLAELHRQRLMPLGWDVDPQDWALPGVAAIEHTMLTARSGDIILCHDGGGNRAETYAALKRVIPVLLRRGHTFVTLPAPQPKR
ncbi:polysaccharide deacetylase family protein [uncultured Jatrophihabitans sp.]|uniref:polysaccharide deacetylase family protein n=1 Tax=uncultured Jatrophihabitans sp. TaxID=1610747 RepID=UPI0035CC4AD3